MNGFRLQDLSYEGLSRLKMSPKTQQSKGHSDVLTLALSLSLSQSQYRFPGLASTCSQRHPSRPCRATSGGPQKPQAALPAIVWPTQKNLLTSVVKALSSFSSAHWPVLFTVRWGRRLVHSSYHSPASGAGAPDSREQALYLIRKVVQQ